MPVVRNIETLKRINVLYVISNELPQEVKIPPTQRTIRDLINGPINSICLKAGTRNKEVILCNANKTNCLSKANRYVSNYGTIYGNFIIALESKDGEYKSLSKEQISKYQKMFNEKSIEQMNTIIKGRLSFRRSLRRM